LIDSLVKEKKMFNSRSFRIILSAALFLFLMQGSFVFARASREADPATVPIKGKILLSTTTSTQDSGLLDFLLPVFTRETGWEVDVVAVGTGAALQMGRGGDADVLLVHARAEEIRFVEEGHGLRRYDVMYNDFLVVGPDLRAIPHNGDVIRTFREIAARGLPFVSRGDNSGTHTMERNLWTAAGLDIASLQNYISVGQGMGATLQMAYELGAYTLTDRATWLTLTSARRINLPAICEGDEALLNYYGVIAVNHARHRGINAEGAQAFVEWMLKDSTQALIGQYGLAEFGGALFTPNAAR
jgi:tungstate transport system substrate-binding protein